MSAIINITVLCIGRLTEDLSRWSRLVGRVESLNSMSAIVNIIVPCIGRLADDLIGSGLLRMTLSLLQSRL